MIHYNNCPVCLQGPVHILFPVVDNSVSKEQFEVWICDNCTAAFTQDVPDSSAIGRYYASENYISHSDTREGIVNKIYHQVRNITLKRKRKLVERETGMLGGKVLDIGAGTGAFANEMKQAGWDVTALEPDGNARQVAGKNYGMKLEPESALFDLDERYDAITLWHVLEHIHQLHEYGEQFKRLLKPGGKLFIAVPNYESADAKFYGPAWAAWDVPRHLYHFTARSMRSFLLLHGLHVLSMKPMWFDSFYVSMLSEPYKTGKQNLPRAVFKGFSSNAAAVRSTSKCSSVIYIAEKV